MDYIDKSRSAGMDDPSIKQELLDAGWQISDVDEALGYTDFHVPNVKRNIILRFLIVALSIILVFTSYIALAKFYFHTWPFRSDSIPFSTIEEGYTPPPTSPAISGPTTTPPTVSTPKLPPQQSPPKTPTVNQPSLVTKSGFLLSGSLCTVDFSLVPQSENNARRLLDFCQKAVLVLEVKFGRGPNAPPYEIKFYTPTAGAQGTGGDANAYVADGQIYLSTNYWQSQVPYDAKILAHEITHVIQSFYGYNTPEYPGWLIEALADYGSYVAGYSSDLEKDCYHFSTDIQSQTRVYDCTYKFLKFIENKYDSTLVFKLHKALQAGSYSESLFVQYTGKTFNQLTSECSQDSNCGGSYHGGL